jgi:5S rRNA maturation endonuclease (ribonuclease M5)
MNLEELKQISSITEVAKHLGLEVDGYRMKCLWPENHKNGDTKPSLLLNEEKGTFKCMACGQWGDAIDLWAKAKGIVGIQAIAELNSLYMGKMGTVMMGRVNIFDFSVIERLRERLWQQENVSVIQYLHSRGLSDKIINNFKLGWNGSGITIPYFLGLGNNGEKKVVGIKIRLYPDKGTKYVSETGSQNILYNYQSLQKMKEAIVVEGEFDVMAMWQMGFRGVITPTGGAQSFSQEYVGYFNDIEKIYLFFDNDEAGEKGAQKAIRLLGSNRCYRVISSYKDANEILVKEKEKAKEIIKKLLESATPITTGKGVTLASLNPYILQGKKPLLTSIHKESSKIKEIVKTFNQKNGLPTGWTGIDHIIGGVKSKYCYLIGADNKVGKSYFILNLMFRLAGHGVPQVYLDLENGSMETMTRMVKVYKKWTDTQLREILEKSPDLIDDAVDEMKKLKIMYYDSSTIRNEYAGKLDIDVVEHLLVGVAESLKCPFMFYIDHLKYFDVPAGKNEYTFYAEAIRRFVEINNNYESTSFVLVHTRKGLNTNDKDGNPKRPKFPTIEDIAGSHMLSATAKCTLILWRDYVTKDSTHKELVVRVASGRSREEGESKLFFDGETPALVEETPVVDKNLSSGWYTGIK